MKEIYILIFSLLLWVDLSGQLFRPTEMATMPERVSNNAVVEGFLNDVPHVFSFAGIDSTKIWSGVHLKSYRYNTITDEWTIIQPLPDPMGGKIGTAASRIDDTIYIAGGYHVLQNGNEISSVKMHRYQISTNTYLDDGADIPVPIDDHVQAVWRDSLIYLVTGWSNSGNVTNVQIYNPKKDSWLVGTPVPNSFYRVFGSTGVIVEDTIYYWGGAANGSNFPAQGRWRKGVINPDNPTEIAWSTGSFAFGVLGYRMAATTSPGKIHWIGGSSVSYNYNGIAYNGSGGVSPSNMNLIVDQATMAWDTSLVYNYPMDLRGIASITPTLKYLAGGMLPGQEVSNKTWRLDWEEDITTSIPQVQIDFSEIAAISPNPAIEVVAIELIEAPMEEINLVIYDMMGKVVMDKKLQSKYTTHDIRSLPAGTYVLELRNDKVFVCNKLLIH